MKSNTQSIAALLALIPMSIFSFSFGQGENIVENGSFESLSGKAKKLGAIEMATGWVSPTGVRADLFTPGSKVPDISTPVNLYGHEDPNEGENYAGIVAYSYNDKMPRTYISTKLSTPLKKGMTYCVQFNVALAELSKYSCNSIGAHISKKPFSTEEKTSIIDKTHVLHRDNKVFNGLYGWDKICATFVADGGEKYITIGNFTNNEKVVTEKNKKPDDIKGTVLIAAYYYIDDVSITLVETPEECECASPDQEETVSNTIYQRSIVLNDKMTPTQKIEAQAVYFGFGKNTLQPAATASLDVIVAELKANPKLKIEITGFSDTKEVEKGAEKPVYADMDKKRVDVIVGYLNEKGITDAQYETNTKADSESNPEITDADEEDIILAKNRRVIFKVIQ
jgi:outer membrane protein OmpA-like peptidoglycan-associated protein